MGQCDSVTLKNGDRISGTIVKKEANKLVVKTEFLGEVTIVWSAVEEIRSDKPLYVVTDENRQLLGTLNTQDRLIQIETPEAQESSSLAAISAIRSDAEQKAYERLVNPRWLNLWVGYFDIGYALARGNAKTTTLTTSMDTSRVTRKDKTRIYFNQIYATATVDRRFAATAQAIRGGWSYDHNVNSRLFFNLFDDYENNRFLNLKFRLVSGGGLGVHLIRSERAVLELLAGSAYNREAFSTETRHSGEAYWGDDWRMKLTGLTSLTQSFRMFDNLSRTGEYRINFDIGTATTLRRWLSLQVSASDRFLSNPVLGRQRNDVLLTTGFRISFAR